MSNIQYIVENIETGKNLGTIEEIAKRTKKGTAKTLEELYKLNQNGIVNFRTNKGRYIQGIRFSLGKKKLNVYNFNVFLPNGERFNSKILHSYLMIYTFQPSYLILLVWILSITKFIVPYEQFIITSIIFFLMIFHIFFHELGHYLVCCYYKIPSIIQVRGLYNSILFKTNSNKENIIVSLAGIIVSIFIFVKILILVTFLEPSILKSIISTSSILMFTMYLLFLPKSVDYQNIRNSIKIILDNKLKKENWG